MKLSKTESIAIGVSVSILIAGYIWGLYTKPVNFARTGSLVTIVGIWFAMLDLAGWLDRAFDQWVERQIQDIGPIPPAFGKNAEARTRERQERRQSQVAGIRMGFAEKKEQAKRRLRTVEGLILILGTFVWGFGDFFYKG